MPSNQPLHLFFDKFMLLPPDNFLLFSPNSLGNIVTPLILATVLIYETFGPPSIKYVLIKVGDAKAVEE